MAKKTDKQQELEQIKIEKDHTTTVRRSYGTLEVSVSRNPTATIDLDELTKKARRPDNGEG
ncbi:MAG: hypothetical protein HN945_23735 [Deltaproteobacteria bacterium]|jgi:hypothetical protein|nr:hypothetical protein [Deltaproteobacteria bacterium]MBT7155467.1 hypothetical protein [Deltaproteobacteria bacterium]